MTFFTRRKADAHTDEDALRNKRQGQEEVPQDSFEARSLRLSRLAKNRTLTLVRQTQPKIRFIENIANVKDVRALQYPVEIPHPYARGTRWLIENPDDLQEIINDANYSDTTCSSRSLSDASLDTRLEDELQNKLDGLQSYFGDYTLFIVAAARRQARLRSMTLEQPDDERLNDMWLDWLSEFKASREKFEEGCRKLGILLRTRHHTEHVRTSTTADGSGMPSRTKAIWS